MVESLVIIPTYNEIENIQRMLDSVMDLEPPFHVLIVDDGSPEWNCRRRENGAETKPPSAFICWSDRENSDWARHTSLVFAGHWNASMNWSTKWIATFRTHPKIWSGCAKPANQGLMLPLDPVTFPAVK